MLLFPGSGERSSKGSWFVQHRFPMRSNNFREVTHAFYRFYSSSFCHHERRFQNLCVSMTTISRARQCFTNTCPYQLYKELRRMYCKVNSNVIFVLQFFNVRAPSKMNLLNIQLPSFYNIEAYDLLCGQNRIHHSSPLLLFIIFSLIELLNWLLRVIF